MSYFAINITFFGNCKRAIEFYETVFTNSSVEIISFGDVSELLGGDSLICGKEDYIYSAKFTIRLEKQEFYLLLADSPSILFSNKGSMNNNDNLTLVIVVEEESLVQDLYYRLLQGGKSNIAPKKNIAGVMEGSLIDAFGVCWILRAG